LTLDLAMLLAPSWAYLIGGAALAVRFARRSPSRRADPPPVSVLKPLHGAEPGLYDNLRSFAVQDYPAHQTVLGVDDPNDGALPAAEAVVRDLPGSDIALVVAPRRSGSNGKVANLENMLPMAKHDVLVLADSDMRVDSCYLAAVTAPLADPETGLVTCLYEGVATGGLWSELGAMHINLGFLPGALISEASGVGNGCFGATIALRREVLDRIGGFARLRDELADDHKIGAAVRELGLRVRLSPYLVAAQVTEPSLVSLWRHELRWARTVRSITPVAFAGSIIMHPVAIATLAAAATGLSLTAWGFLAITCALRCLSAEIISRGLGLAPVRWRLLPLRDALSFAVYVASYFGRTVFWRDQILHVAPSGRMTVEREEAL
jgi:ceramide glucosyltransferase